MYRSDNISNREFETCPTKAYFRPRHECNGSIYARADSAGPITSATVAARGFLRRGDWSDSLYDLPFSQPGRSNIRISGISDYRVSTLVQEIGQVIGAICCGLATLIGGSDVLGVNRGMYKRVFHLPVPNRVHSSLPLRSLSIPRLAMRVLFAIITLVAVAVGQAVNPAAFNPQLTNSIPNIGGPVLYYNGSGPVPPYDSMSPSPPALPSSTYLLSQARMLTLVVQNKSKTTCTQKSHRSIRAKSFPTIAPPALQQLKSCTSQP